MTAPLERLAEILAWHKDCGCGCAEVVAEVERLWAERSDLEQYITTYCPTPAERAEVERLRAEVARLEHQVHIERVRAMTSKWEQPVSEGERLQARLAAVEALKGGPFSGGYRPYAVNIDGEVILAVGLDDLRAALGDQS